MLLELPNFKTLAMLIEINTDTFQTEKFRELNTLIQLLVYKGRYQVFIDFSLIRDNPIYLRLDEDDRKLIEQQFNRVIQESRKVDVFISESEPEKFGLSEAIRYFNQPFIILVENSRNDGHFIRALFRNFDKSGKLTQHLQNGWLEIGNAGGQNNFINFLTDKLRNFRTLPKPNHSYLRVFVIIDSDKKWLEQSLTDNQQNLIHFLEDNQIPFHILEKREMENYLPDEVIDTIEDDRDFVDAYLHLNPIQKDFFDLENGLPNKNFQQLPDEIRALFEDVSENDRRILRQGSFSNKYKNLKQSFKSEFPRLFHHVLVNQETLLKRCEHHENNPDELPDLIEKLIHLI